MLGLMDVANWLLEQMPDLQGRIAVGGIDGNERFFVGVYDRKNGSGKQRICLGGLMQTHYQKKQISILVHWGSPVEAEKKAAEIHNLFFGRSGFHIGDSYIFSVDAGGAPIWVGKDDRGISEYVISVDLLYEI